MHSQEVTSRSTEHVSAIYHKIDQVWGYRVWRKTWARARNTSTCSTCANRRASNSGRFVAKEVGTNVNPTDLMTRPLLVPKIEQLMIIMGCEFVEHRLKRDGPHGVGPVSSRQQVEPSPNTMPQTTGGIAASRLGQPSGVRDLVLFLAEDLDREALAALVADKLRGSWKVTAVKAPSFWPQHEGHASESDGEMTPEEIVESRRI